MTPSNRAPQEGEIATAASGRKVVYRGGKWDYADEAPARQGRVVSGQELADMTDTSLGRVGRDIREGLEDAGQGIASALSFGWDDELAAKAGNEEYGARKAAREARSAARAQQAQDELGLEGAGRLLVPSASSAGAMLGTAVSGAGTGALATRAATGLGRAAQAGVHGAELVGTSALEGAGNAAEGERLQGAAGATTGASAIAGAVGLGGAAGRGLVNAAPALARRADDLRVQSVGLVPGKVRGEPGGVERQAEVLREYGVGRGWFTGNRGMERQAEAGIAKAEAGRGAIEQFVPPDARIADEGPADALRQYAVEIERADAPLGKRYARAADNLQYRPGTEADRPVLPQRPYVYHASPAANAAGIAEKGLLPSEGGKNFGWAHNKGRVFFSPEGAKFDESKIMDAAGADSVTRYRARATVAPVKGANESVMQRDTPVSPDRLEVQDPDGTWRRLRPDLPPPPTHGPVPRRVRREGGLGLDELKRYKQNYSPANYADASQDKEFRKNAAGVFRDAQNQLVENFVPGRGGEYKRLGQDEAALLRARDALVMKSEGPPPATTWEALRRMARSGVVGGWHAAEADLSKRALPALGRKMARGARASRGMGSFLARRASQEIENSEYPEDEYYRQYMSNPDFRHSGP